MSTNRKDYLHWLTEEAQLGQCSHPEHKTPGHGPGLKSKPCDWRELGPVPPETVRVGGGGGILFLICEQDQVEMPGQNAENHYRVTLVLD